MGREIRMVPPNWEHPKDESGKYKPMYDHGFQSSANKWVADLIAWQNGTHEKQVSYPDYKTDMPFYWQYENPPDDEYCRPDFKEEPTWYQVYETVSEGTPVSPPFASKEELVNYLVEFGDFWQQQKWEKRFTDNWCRDAQKPGWNRKSAEQFVESEWAPSMWVTETGVHTIENSTMPK